MSAPRHPRRRRRLRARRRLRRPTFAGLVALLEDKAAPCHRRSSCRHMRPRRPLCAARAGAQRRAAAVRRHGPRPVATRCKRATGQPWQVTHGRRARRADAARDGQGRRSRPSAQAVLRVADGAGGARRLPRCELLESWTNQRSAMMNNLEDIMAMAQNVQAELDEGAGESRHDRGRGRLGRRAGQGQGVRQGPDHRYRYRRIRWCRCRRSRCSRT